MLRPIGIVGAGAWGTALAIILSQTGGDAGQSVTLWARRDQFAAALHTSRVNRAYLPDVVIPPTITISSDPAALGEAAMLIFACPAQHVAEIAGALAMISPDAILISAAKGIVQDGQRRISEILRAIFPTHIVAALSGPSFAAEVAAGLPTAVTIAAPTLAIANRLASHLSRKSFRLYASDDLIGVELGAAAKNVLAIAVGIAIGRQLGDNARAALITRGLAEMMRIGRALGAKAETLTGLSGLGDLVLTATGLQSRNLRLGIALGQGGRLGDLMQGEIHAIEGIATAPALLHLAEARHIEMPITAAIVQILDHGAAIGEVMQTLLDRPLRSEADHG